MQGDKTLLLCQDERPTASQAPMRYAWSDRAYRGACGAVLASPACLALLARRGVMLLSGKHAEDSVASPTAGSATTPETRHPLASLPRRW